LPLAEILGGKAELGDVRSRRDVDPDFIVAASLHVVLGKPLSNLARRGPYHVIRVGIVIGRSAKNFGAQHPLLDIVRTAVESLLDDEFEERGVPLTGPKYGITEYSLQLL
jgi:hypothetical protein